MPAPDQIPSEQNSALSDAQLPRNRTSHAVAANCLRARMEPRANPPEHLAKIKLDSRRFSDNDLGCSGRNVERLLVGC
jgi:hypothetical protein